MREARWMEIADAIDMPDPDRLVLLNRFTVPPMGHAQPHRLNIEIGYDRVAGRVYRSSTIAGTQNITWSMLEEAGV